MFSVSNFFKQAEMGLGNQPITRAYLVLGNYANAIAYGATIVASSIDGSGNYPASGAIDGDRTELNVGAASAADNNFGLSSWRSATAPDTTPQTLTINFGSQRTINRIKLYHLLSSGLKTFKFSWSNDNSSYTDFAATSDIVSGSQVSIVTTAKLDTVDFSDVTCQYLKLTISHTKNGGDPANVVEIECYRNLDITSRVISAKTSRGRDYKFFNPIASTVELTCDNSDRFFSFNYTPTAAEVLSGFVNSELKPNMGIIVQYGFAYGAFTEYASVFNGFADTIAINSGARTATISGRDGMKTLINQVKYSNLKSAQDIAACVQYALNLCNISTYETSIDTTSITIDYFFINGDNILTIIQELVQAEADGVFFFDENGIANFKNYLAAINESHTDTTEGDFESGTVITNINTTQPQNQISRDWFLVDDFADGDYYFNPTWIQSGYLGWGVASNKLTYIDPGVAVDGTSLIYTTLPSTIGTWQADVTVNLLFPNSAKAFFWFAMNDDGSGHATLSYGLEFSSDGSIRLVFISGSFLISGLASATGGTGTYRITRDSFGTFNVYLNGVFLMTAGNLSYTSFSKIGFSVAATNTGATRFTADNIYFSPSIEVTKTVTNTVATFESEIIDQTGPTVEGLFQASTLTPSGTSINFYTATSSDGISWDAYVAAFVGVQISSTPKRYLKWKAILNCPIDDGNHNANLTTPIIYDVTINWTIGAGSPKYPTTPQYAFSHKDVLLGIDQQYSDNIGGDSSIVNDALVQAQPLILSGTDSDTQWQGTVQTPPVPISGTAHLGVTIGQILTYPISISGGMNIGLMSGANPAAAVITFGGGGAGTWVFTKIHPTQPVLQITITGTGYIQDLRVVGKAFANDDTKLQSAAIDSLSINTYGDRQTSLSSQFMVNQTISDLVASKLVANYKNPTSYIPGATLRPIFSMQLNDRATMIDDNTGLNADYLIVGIDHELTVALDAATCQTGIQLLKIPI